MSQDKPIKEIQPVVVPAQYFVFGPLASGFFALFPGMFAFVISNMIVQSHKPYVTVGLIVYLLAFATVMYLLYLKLFKEPEKTTYRIFEDRIEYSDGFLNKRQRTVVFDQVIDVILNEGVLQQTKNAGTIILITQQLVSSGEGKLSNRSVALKNVPDPQEVFDLIRDLAINGKKNRKGEV